MLSDCLEDAPDETVHRLIGLVQRSADRLNRFTNKALALLQIDSGHMKKMMQQPQQTHNICEVVDTAVSTIKHEVDLDGRKVKIKITGNHNPAYVDGHFDYLLMMIEELLRNAVVFSPDNSTVSIAILTYAEQVSVAIQDRGPGIAEEELPLVWNRFTQINRDHYEQPGIGIGLSIVRDSARIHGGDCVIESEKGKGTLVTLNLPLSR
jgi:signal transduction histidine kinase